MKYNKIVKENDYNKNSFLITTISCVVLLLTLCYFGINSGVKGTYSVSSTCDSGWLLVGNGAKCCPVGFTYSANGNLCYSTTVEGDNCKYDKGDEDSVYSCSTSAKNPIVTYTASFMNKNGATAWSQKQCTTTSSSCTVDKPSNPSESGYTFTGWSKSSSCASLTTNFTISSDTKFYSCWKAVETETSKTYTATFMNKNGATAWSQKQCTTTSGSCTVDKPSNPSESGYTFTGWSKSSSCASLTTNFTISSDTKFYSCWKAEETTVEYKCYKCDDTNAYEWNSSSRSGCSVKSDYTTQSTCLAQNRACYECTTVGTGEITYYYGQVEVYADSKTCKQKGGYNPSDNGKACLALNDDDEPSNPSNPSNPDSGDEDDDGNSGGGDTTPTTPTTKKFTATFDKNGGTLNGDETKSCTTPGDSCTISDLPDAKRDGYTFKGWGTSETCKSGNTSSLTLNSDKKFYACWVNSSNTDEDGNVTENAPTGETTMIAIIWFVGLMAIGYAFYYFKNVREN